MNSITTVTLLILTFYFMVALAVIYVTYPGVALGQQQ